MKVNVLYNTSGKVIAYWGENSGIDLSGNLNLLVDIPDGKCIDYIDVSGDEPTPVFKDVPKTQQDELEELKAQVTLLALMTDIELPSEGGEY